MGQRWRENRGRGGEVGYLDPHANPPERRSQHSSQQSASGQRLPPTPANLHKQKRQETTVAGGGPSTHQRARSTQLLREKRRRRTTWWRGGRGGDSGSVRSALTNLAARKSAVTRVGRSRASPISPASGTPRASLGASQLGSAGADSECSAHPHEAGAHRSQTRSRKRETPSLRANGARRKQGK